jgi:hypothetical protein
VNLSGRQLTQSGRLSGEKIPEFHFQNPVLSIFSEKSFPQSEKESIGTDETDKITKVNLFMIKSIVITLLMWELLHEGVVTQKIPDMPYNGQGQCLTSDMKIIECE